VTPWLCQVINTQNAALLKGVRTRRCMPRDGRRTNSSRSTTVPTIVSDAGPRMRRANAMSFMIRNLRPPCSAHIMASAITPARYSCAASCRATISVDWKRRSVVYSLSPMLSTLFVA